MKNSSLHKLFENLEISIGDVSKSIGVTQRQIRYWEQKGYIKPINDKSGVRRYNLTTVYTIGFIKDQLDAGYTLAAAYEHSKDIKTKSKIMRKFSRKIFDNITIQDEEKAYGTIDIGNISVDDKNYRIQGIVDENGSYFALKDKD